MYTTKTLKYMCIHCTTKTLKYLYRYTTKTLKYRYCQLKWKWHKYTTKKYWHLH